jgi:CheY-like chemotaxis protein
VDLYRGKIYIESKVGRGSTFTVKLPVSKELFQEEEIVEKELDLVKESGQAIVGPHEAVYPERRYGKKENLPKMSPVILIVEDNTDLRNYISENLDESYQILMTENGKSGFDLAIENIPDLIISDVMMPEMDGMELCHHLKQDERTNHIPVIMLTAKADRDNKLEGLDTGVDDYLIKPFDAEELQHRVRNLIEQRKRLREKYRKKFLTEPVTAEDKPVQTDDFLTKVLNLVQSNLSDSGYNVEQLCRNVGLSQSQLYRKLMALTDHSPVEFIRCIRLKAAAEMFQKGATNVSTVLYSAGFSTPSHFSRYFRELYGVNPSDYIRKLSLIG